MWISTSIHLYTTFWERSYFSPLCQCNFILCAICIIVLVIEYEHCLLSSCTECSQEKEAAGEAATTDRWDSVYYWVPERGTGECPNQHWGPQEHELCRQSPEGCTPTPVRVFVPFRFIINFPLYVYTYMYTRTCMYIHMQMYIHVYTYMWTCVMHAFVWALLFVHVLFYACASTII